MEMPSTVGSFLAKEIASEKAMGEKQAWPLRRKRSLLPKDNDKVNVETRR